MSTRNGRPPPPPDTTRARHCGLSCGMAVWPLDYLIPLEEESSITEQYPRWYSCGSYTYIHSAAGAK